jgi:hypothetical protein
VKTTLQAGEGVFMAPGHGAEAAVDGKATPGVVLLLPATPGGKATPWGHDVQYR